MGPGTCRVFRRYPLAAPLALLLFSCLTQLHPSLRFQRVSMCMGQGCVSGQCTGGESRGNGGPCQSSPTTRRKASPKIHGFNPLRIPEWIRNHTAILQAKRRLPAGYEFELAKTAWNIYRRKVRRVALQLPEGLLRCAPILSDVFEQVCGAATVTLADVVYGACCLDDERAHALGCESLIHYGHSCLIPVTNTKIPTLYVFVSIRMDALALASAIERYDFSATVLPPLGNTTATSSVKIALMGTVQFANALQECCKRLSSSSPPPPAAAAGGGGGGVASPRLLDVYIPQALPLSPGEVLGCTSPIVSKDTHAVVFVADGTFHLESAMLQNTHVRLFLRYDPYTKTLQRASYPVSDIVSRRKQAVLQASRGATRWGIIQGILGRQGNPQIVQRIEAIIKGKGFDVVKIPVPEITPRLLAAFPKIDAWVQIACPRLSIDWGSEYTQKPLLTPYEAFVALNATAAEESTETASIPMDFYARRGGEWSNYYRRLRGGGRSRRRKKREQKQREKAELQDDDEEEEEEDNENDGDYQDEGRDYDGNKDDDDDGDDRSVSATAAALACATITEIEKNKKSKHGERRRKECISEEEWREENEADPKSSKKQLLHEQSVEYDRITGVPAEYNEHLPRDSPEFRRWSETQPKKDVSPAAHSSRSTSSSKEVLVRIGTRAFKKPGTLVIGLDSYGIELSDAKKKFAKKFACACSVGKSCKETNKPHVFIQGNKLYDLPGLLVELYGSTNGITRAAIKELQKDGKKRAIPDIYAD